MNLRTDKNVLIPELIHLPYNLTLNSSHQPMDVTVRRARSADILQVYEVFASSLRKLCSRHYTPEQIHASLQVMNHEVYAKSIDTDVFLVCEFAENVVGFGRMQTSMGEITGLYVDPDFAGRGIGSALLRQLEDVAVAMRWDQTQLYATLNSVGFYKKAGYGINSLTMTELAEGVVLPSVRMIKPFSTSR